MENGSWLKTAIVTLGIPFLLALVSNFAIPNIIEKSNRAEALRTARLKKALEIRDHNEDFTVKLHRLKTMMQTFNRQNVRRKLSGAQLAERQDEFQKEYSERYLTLDETAWWWYWNLERDAEIYDLLSPDETKTLAPLVKKYGEDTAASVGAIDPLWSYLSSSKYRLSKSGQNEIKKLEDEMNANVDKLFYDRFSLDKEMSALFAQSHYKPDH